MTTATKSEFKVTPTFQRRVYVEYIPTPEDFVVTIEAPKDTGYASINVHAMIQVSLKEEFRQQLEGYNINGIPSPYEKFRKYSDFRGCKTKKSKENKTQKVFDEVNQDFESRKEEVTQKLIEEAINGLKDWVERNNKEALYNDVRLFKKFWDGDDIDKSIPESEELVAKREALLKELKNTEAKIVENRNEHILAKMEKGDWIIINKEHGERAVEYNLHPTLKEKLTEDMQKNEYFGFSRSPF